MLKQIFKLIQIVNYLVQRYIMIDFVQIPTHKVEQKNERDK